MNFNTEFLKKYHNKPEDLIKLLISLKQDPREFCFHIINNIDITKIDTYPNIKYIYNISKKENKTLSYVFNFIVEKRNDYDSETFYIKFIEKLLKLEEFRHNLILNLISSLIEESNICMEVDELEDGIQDMKLNVLNDFKSILNDEGFNFINKESDETKERNIRLDMIKKNKYACEVIYKNNKLVQILTTVYIIDRDKPISRSEKITNKYGKIDESGKGSVAEDVIIEDVAIPFNKRIDKVSTKFYFCVSNAIDYIYKVKMNKLNTDKLIFMISGSKINHIGDGYKNNPESRLCMKTSYDMLCNKISFVFPLDNKYICLYPNLFIIRDKIDDWCYFSVINVTMPLNPKVNLKSKQLNGYDNRLFINKNVKLIDPLVEIDIRNKLRKSFEICEYMGYNIIVIEDLSIINNNLPCQSIIKILKEIIDEFNFIKEIHVCNENENVVELFKKIFNCL